MTSGARLVIIRHGRSSQPHARGFIDADGVEQWRDAQDVAGITKDSLPPKVLVDRVARAGLVLASNMARAIESAERLAPGRPIQISPLFRECQSVTPTWIRLRWPLRIWLIGTGAQWMYRILRGTDASPADRERVAEASHFLTEVAPEYEMIALVCHGMFRRLLAAQLVRDGWTAVPGPHSYRHWSAWEFIAP